MKSSLRSSGTTISQTDCRLDFMWLVRRFEASQKTAMTTKKRWGRRARCLARTRTLYCRGCMLVNRTGIFCSTFGRRCTESEFNYLKFIALHSRPLSNSQPLNPLFRHQVNVFSCAPKSMNKDIERVCSQYNRKGFDFHFLHEALSWINILLLN